MVNAIQGLFSFFPGGSKKRKKQILDKKSKKAKVEIVDDEDDDDDDEEDVCIISYTGFNYILRFFLVFKCVVLETVIICWFKTGATESFS